MNAYYEKSLVQKIADKIKTYCKDNRIPLLTTMIVGLLAYTYAFTNKFPNWDDVSCIFNKGATIDAGRWALEIMSWIFPDFSMPWIYGIISLAIMGIANSVLIQELKIREPILQIVFSGLVTVFPAFISTVPFMFTLASYAVSFLMACMAVRCANCQSKRVKLTGIFLSVISMGIYQAYLAVTSSFFLICLIRYLMIEEKDVKYVIQKGLYYLLHLAATCVLYLLVTFVIQKAAGTGYSTYAQDRMDFWGVLSLPKIKRTYTVLITELLYGEYGFLSSPFARVCHVITFFISGIIIVKWMFDSKNIAKSILLVVLLVLLPLSIDSFVLIVSNNMIQSMLFYSFVAAYGLACMLIENKYTNGEKNGTFLYDVTVLALTVIVVCNIYFANRTFLHLQVANMNVYSFYTSLTARIQGAEDFENAKKIALIGDADQYLYERDDFKRDGLSQARAVDFSVNIYSRYEYLKYYIGFDIPRAKDEEIVKIRQSEEFKEMNIYPYEGSIQVFDDIIVVKFSDPEVGEP